MLLGGVCLPPRFSHLYVLPDETYAIMMIQSRLFAFTCHAIVCLTLASLPALAWGDQFVEVTCPPVDAPPEAMFDVVKQVDTFESATLRWTPSRTDQNAHCTLHHDPTQQRGTAGSMRVDYEFIGKRDYEYLQFGTPLEVPKSGLAFGFWLKLHDGSFPVRLRIADKSGETHQFDLISDETSEWQFVAGLLDGPSTSWGGDGNGRCDYPCRLGGIVLDRPRQGFVSKGTLWIDGVALLRPRPMSQALKVATRTSRFGNLYAVGESVELRIAGPNAEALGAETAGNRIEWKWEDYWGQVLAHGESADGWANVQFKLPRPGYFVCRIDLYHKTRLVESRQYCCAALRGGHETARSDFVGVCSHYGHNSYPLPSMDLMCAYGIDQFRDEISWGSYEPQRGVYAMPKHAAAFLQHAARLKMRPLIIYDYSNSLYDQGGFPNSPEAIAAFSAYAVDLTRATRGKVGMFEIWNEWIGGCGMNGRSGDHGPEAYGRLQKAAYAAVKKACPDITVVGIGGEYGADCAENIARALKTAGPDSMDAWSIHPYRYPKSPEESELVAEIGRIAKRVRSAGAQQKIWITEIGWPTHRTVRGSSEANQARHCVRTLALLQSTDLVEKVFWYDFKDDGTRRDYNEHNFGLVRHQTYNCAPKPGVVAMSVFIRMTGGAPFRQLQSSGSCYMARYERPDGRDVIVAWSATDVLDVKVTGHVDQVVDIMGADVGISKVDKLTLDPIYIVGKDLKVDAEWHGTPCRE